MSHNNLLNYSDQELSLRVFNDEGLYPIRHRSILWEVLEEMFIYTDAQREELERDLVDELELEERG